jgi:excisionase family DNA binding protein
MMIVDPSERLTINVAEACRRTGLGKDALLHFVRAGKIPAIRVGRRFAIPVRGLEAAIESLGREHAEEFAEGAPAPAPQRRDHRKRDGASA